MVWVNNDPKRVNDVFLDLVEPLWGAWSEVGHGNVLAPLSLIHVVGEVLSGLTLIWFKNKAKYMLMLTTRRLNAYIATTVMVLAVLIQQVVTEGLLSDFDRSARLTARSIRASHDVFSVTVMLGLRGIILTVCLPILGWVSLKRRSWLPIAGFLIVLVFETGIAGALKISVGRIFPYQYESFFSRMMIGQDEMAFPSGHAANCVALWGYMVWYFTQAGSVLRRAGIWLVVLASCIVGVSSWLIRTHWPTDLLAGYAVGFSALVAVIGLYTALGFNPEATTHYSQEAHRETADAQ